MIKKIIKIFIPKKLLDYYKLNLKKYKKISYSQCGEDLIILPLIKKLNKNKPAYIDIGAFHPYKYSNTALLYKMGWHGINIEPNSDNIKWFEHTRKRDINLNIGAYNTGGNLTYYKLSEPTLNTFSEKEAKKYVEKHNFKILETIDIPVLTIKEILKKYCDDKFPPFLNLDTEGTEIEILKTIDFRNNYPQIICLETMGYGGFTSKNKDTEATDLLLDADYTIYGQTSINTIFVKKDWIKY